ncbi:putative galacturonosyltransferase 7 isoform X2 [Carex rostrata]
MRKFGPSLKKDIVEKIRVKSDKLTNKKSTGATSKSSGSRTKKGTKPEPLAPALGSFDTIEVEQTKNSIDLSQTGPTQSCQLQFGSYCLWSAQHKESMMDSLLRRLKDQLFIARAYYPSIAKKKEQEKLTKEVKHNIQEHERMLSEAISDADLPHSSGKSMENMDQTTEKAKSCNIDCRNFERKLRQLVDLTEEETHFHMRQSAFLYHLAVQTVPKTHHCLILRLTVEYFRNSLTGDLEDRRSIYEVENAKLQHFVVLSTNVLAVSVTINSTVMNLRDSRNAVFHILTDSQNFYAIKHFFARNNYKNATVHVLNFELLKLKHTNSQNLLPSEEFRVIARNKTEYISVFSHSHFLLPEIFPDLQKIVLLDDDLVVQRDLSRLFEIDLEEKVVGAVNFCRVRLGQIKGYLNGFDYGANEDCLWISGLNVVDLKKWREMSISSTYQGLVKKLQNEKESNPKQWREMSFSLTILALKDQVHELEDSWIQSGLGHDYAISDGALQNATTLHYNGNMKPWLDMGIPKYKDYWRKYVTHTERFMDECNV